MNHALVALFALATTLAAQQPAGTVKHTWQLATANTKAWGLGYRPGNPTRLYVADHSRHQIFVYQKTLLGLADLPLERIQTNALNPAFTNPRGVAFESYLSTPYLYVLTSNNNNLSNRLWRIDLTQNRARYVDLNHLNFGISGLAVHGLEVHDGYAYISYDTTTIPASANPESKGILKLSVATSASAWWLAEVGYAQVDQLPHSGRVTTNSNTNTTQVAPCFGLGILESGNREFLWGTSFHRFLYVQEPTHGRGLFHIDSPGAARIYGVAAGGGSVFVVDRASGANQIHELDPGLTSNDPVQKDRKVRRVTFTLESQPERNVASDCLFHSFATPPSTNYRPNQGRSYQSFDFQTVVLDGAQNVLPNHNFAHMVAYAPYFPAGDASAACYPLRASIYGSFAGNQTVRSTFSCDVWTSFRRHFVYPHRCNNSGSVNSGYRADNWTLYRTSDTSAYGGFLWDMINTMASEYDASVAFAGDNYWLARNVLEYIKEQYNYGTTGGTYHPANTKITLPFDGIPNNELLKCSSSTFAFEGVMRYLGFPTRWVGTTRRRALGTVGADGLWSSSETVLDESFHRWAEVWLGSNYGWQRFDPTPSRTGPRQLSQFDLTAAAACGVDERDLVMHVGSGTVTTFYRQNEDLQWYNSVPRYNNPGSWRTKEATRAVWSNPCSLNITYRSPSGPTRLLRWIPQGPWTLDPEAMLVVHDTDGNALSSAVRWNQGLLTFSVASLSPGLHLLYLVKQQDTLTGQPFAVLVR